MYPIRSAVCALVAIIAGCSQDTSIDDRIVGQWLCQPRGENGVSIGFAFKSDGDVLVATFGKADLSGGLADLLEAMDESSTIPFIYSSTGTWNATGSELTIDVTPKNDGEGLEGTYKGNVSFTSDSELTWDSGDAPLNLVRTNWIDRL